jgi:hypothetical protein
MLTLLIAGLVVAQQAIPQLGPAQLDPLTLGFRIENGKLVGNGGEFLRREIASSRATLLGEYHGSQRISELTKALIEPMHLAGYRHMALEVGPTTAKILTEIGKSKDGALSRLRSLNSKYLIHMPGRVFTPIPFFSGVADAEFLGSATDRGWKLFGVDQEFHFGFLMLLDRLEEIASPALSEEIEKTRALILTGYDSRRKGGREDSTILFKSAELSDLVKKLEKIGGEAAQIGRDLRRSAQIYHLNEIGDWWGSNGSRIAHMKENFHFGLNSTNFSFDRDRLFLKIGSVHNGRGLSLLRHFELGNTISELAELRGERSLHICVMYRFWKDGDGSVVDTISTDKRYEVLRSQGALDEWRVIDLRPLKRTVFYDGVTYEKFVGEAFTQYDLVIVSPTDEEPVLNVNPGLKQF